MEIFNSNNTTWKEGKYPLFLGEAPALYDSINVTYPKMFQLYKSQKSSDWNEDEISLEQSRIDMQSCDPSMRDIMVKNLALQWEFDSVASRAIAPLFAPFVTNSEFWAALLKNSEIEVLHALTYSEIVRQCIPDTKEIFKEVLQNENILGRMIPVLEAFNALQKAGAQYTLGLITNEQAYPIVMMGLVALYCLERLQFVVSFSATFAVVEQGAFQGIGKLVQKIMQDERFIHSEVDKLAIEIELSTERGKKWLSENKPDVEKLIDSVVDVEYRWAEYLPSEGRKVVGYNETLMKEYVDFNAQDVYHTLQIDKPVIKKNPLKYMDNWLDLNKNQNAQQEADSANYSLNIIFDDLGDEIIEFGGYEKC
jgi:ribonucleoside-diphosphate reductase beta chain